MGGAVTGPVAVVRGMGMGGPPYVGKGAASTSDIMPGAPPTRSLLLAEPWAVASAGTGGPPYVGTGAACTLCRCTGCRREGTSPMLNESLSSPPLVALVTLLLGRSLEEGWLEGWQGMGTGWPAGPEWGGAR